MKKTIQELRLFDGFILTLTIDLIKSIRSKFCRHLIIGNYSVLRERNPIKMCHQQHKHFVTLSLETNDRAVKSRN